MTPTGTQNMTEIITFGKKIVEKNNQIMKDS